MPPVLVIGHRGFAARFPDNSLAGVRAALAAGADGVEVDVRRCADGTWVCHHDRSRGGATIAAWSLPSLRRDGVPTLLEVIETVPDARHLFVEVKPLPAPALEDGLEDLVALLRRCAGSRVISSSGAVLAAVARALPGAPRSLVFDDVPRSLPDEVELSPFHRLVERLLASGRPLHPWTVNGSERMRDLAGMGVASITTDRPDLAVEVLRG